MSYDYGFEEGLYNNKGVFDDMSIRKGFIRKVYSLLSIQLIFTTILTSLFVLNDSVKSFGQSDTGQGLLVLSIVTMLATLIAPLCCCMDAYKKYPQNYAILSIFTLSTSYMVAVGASSYSPDTVLYAFIITCVSTIALTIYAMQTKYDFTTSGGILLSLLIGLMVMGILNIFVQNQFLKTFIAAAGAVIFSMYIVYDTQLIVGGKHRKHQFDVDDYVFATITLYLDIINLFLYLLELLDGKRNENN